MNLDDDVLRAARELARLQGRTLGEVVSALVRAALASGHEEMPVRNGVPVLGPVAGAQLVTTEDVARLLDEEETAP